MCRVVDLVGVEAREVVRVVGLFGVSVEYLVRVIVSFRTYAICTA